MKKIVVFLFVFLFSCSINEKDENISKEKNISSKNVKNICDSVSKWENFEDFEKKFWEATLLSQTSETSAYYYWDKTSEACTIYVSNWEVIDKVYVKI